MKKNTGADLVLVALEPPNMGKANNHLGRANKENKESRPIDAP